MKVKKKITRHPYDFVAAEEYFNEAKICPNCGASSSPQCVCTTITTKGVTKIEFQCKCGCEWEVKPYREKKFCGRRKYVQNRR